MEAIKSSRSIARSVRSSWVNDFPVQVGMQTTQAAQARPASERKVGKVGNPDPEGAADDHVADVAPAVHQDGQLSLGVPG